MYFGYSRNTAQLLKNLKFSLKILFITSIISILKFGGNAGHFKYSSANTEA